MIENNVIINFSSSRNIRELSELVDDVYKVMGLSLLNRELVKLKGQPQQNDYSLVINLALSEVHERSIQNVFRKRKYNIFWSDFENMES
jgi:hypothetical protein